MKIVIGVIFGGDSVEHEVSIISAIQAIDFLDKEKYEVVPIYISKDRQWYTGQNLTKMETYKDLDLLKKQTSQVCLTKKGNEYVLIKTKGIRKNIVKKIDIAFPIVHGKGVEDGSLAGYLDTLGIPYVGCEMLGSSIGQDKVIQKQIMKSEGIPVVDYIWFYENEFLMNKNPIMKQINSLGYPVVVKPARLGSSIGITFVKNEKELEEAIELALEYDEKIIVEKAVHNLLEVDCAVVGNNETMETSLIGEMLSENDILTFEDKYLKEASKKSPSLKCSDSSINVGFKIPAQLDKKLEDEIYDLSKKTFRALNLKGVVRFDFLIDSKNKKVYMNEPNTIPGCLAFFFFTQKFGYKELLDTLIDLTLKDYRKNRKKISSYESNILSTYNGSKGVKGKIR